MLPGGRGVEKTRAMNNQLSATNGTSVNAARMVNKTHHTEALVITRQGSANKKPKMPKTQTIENASPRAKSQIAKPLAQRPPKQPIARVIPIQESAIGWPRTRRLTTGNRETRAKATAEIGSHRESPKRASKTPSSVDPIRILKHHGSMMVSPCSRSTRTRHRGNILLVAQWQRSTISSCRRKGNSGINSPLMHLIVTPWTSTLGNVAYRTGKKSEWDYQNLRAPNAPESAPFIKRPMYRKGWDDILKA